LSNLCGFLGAAARFEISYTGLSFAAPQEVRFEVKLEGDENGMAYGGRPARGEFRDLAPVTMFSESALPTTTGFGTKQERASPSPWSRSFGRRPGFVRARHCC